MKKNHLFLFIALVMLTSCDSNRFFEENREIEGGVWDMKQKLEFNFEVPDTIQGYNFYFNIRNTEEYQFSNVYVFFRTYFPNGKIGTDTVEFPLADPVTGKWLGKGQGDIYDCQLMFRRNVRFPLAGKYRMEVEQAMRMEQLPGVVDAGIRIEKAGE